MRLKHLDTFASANSHSGALGVVHGIGEGRTLSPEFARIFGDDPSGGSEDPFALVEQADHGLLPKIRIDCGTDDFLLDQNKAFHEHLESLNITHEYNEYGGGHEWAYWDAHVPAAIEFHARNLGLT